MSKLAVKENKSVKYYMTLNDCHYKVWVNKKEIYLSGADIIKYYNLDSMKSIRNSIYCKKERMDYIDIINLASLVGTNPYFAKEAFDILEVAEIIANYAQKDLKWIIYTLQKQIANHSNLSVIYESDVVSWFEKKYKNILGEGVEIVSNKDDEYNKPDLWVKEKENYIPIEVKRNGFDKKSLKQLERYINFYNVSKGIAIGTELKCDLPHNIKFIQYNRKSVLDEKKKMYLDS